MHDLKDALGAGGTIALVALIVGFLVRLLKADKMNALLARFSIPPIPKLALPWVALVAGFVAMMLDAKVAGSTWGAALAAGISGILSGALAIAGNEAVANPVAKLSPTLGKVIFGKKPDEPCPPTNDVVAAPNTDDIPTPPLPPPPAPPPPAA